MPNGQLSPNSLERARPTYGRRQQTLLRGDVTTAPSSQHHRAAKIPPLKLAADPYDFDAYMVSGNLTEPAGRNEDEDPKRRSRQRIGYTETHKRPKSPCATPDPYDFEPFTALEERGQLVPKARMASTTTGVDFTQTNAQGVKRGQPVRGRLDVPRPRCTLGQEDHDDKNNKLPLPASRSSPSTTSSDTKDLQLPQNNSGKPDSTAIALNTSECWQSLADNETMVPTELPRSPTHRRQQPPRGLQPKHTPAPRQSLQVTIERKRPASVCDTQDNSSVKRHRKVADDLALTGCAPKGQRVMLATQRQSHTVWKSRSLLQCDQQACASEDDDMEPRQSYGHDTSHTTSPINDMPAAGIPSKSEPTPRPSKSRGIKHTYGSGRTILAAHASESVELPSNSLDSFALDIVMSTGHNPLSLEGEDETPSISQPAFQSVHELRRAGANSRFAVEIEELFERISSPGLTRRNALLEFALGLGRDDFITRFHNAGMPISFINELRNESDLVSCFCLLAVITTLLASTSAARVAGQLREHGVTELLDRTLSRTDRIGQMWKASKPNMSRSARQSLSVLEARLIRLDAFKLPKSANEGQTAVRSLTPQALSLAVLQLLADSCPEHEYVAITAPLADTMFGILDTCVDLDTSIARLTLPVLENWCIKTVLCVDQPFWKQSQTRIVAKLLHMAIRRDTCAFADVETMVLKLALNITKNNPEASVSFAETGPSEGALIRGMARGVCDRLACLKSTIPREESYTKMLGDLVLMINVMINICGRNPRNRDLLHQSHESGDPSLTNMIRTFQQYSRSIDDSDSIEQNNLLVALRFLSVLLGYLSLHPRIRQLWSTGKTETRLGLNGVINSIQRLLDAHRQAQDEANAADDLPIRLQNLITELHLSAMQLTP